MDQLVLNLENRENTGKGFSRRLRSAGRVPAVIYGMGDPSHVSIDPRNLIRNLLTESGKNAIYNLEGAGMDGKHALVKDYQVDPLSRQLLHVDFKQIDVSQKVEVTVSIHLVGKSPGVVDGGILNVIDREVTVTCLPNAIPSHIDADVSGLQINDSLHLDDIALPEGVEKVGSANPTLVAVVPPAKEEEQQAAVDGAAEPEVLSQKKDDEKAAGGGDKDKK